MTGDVSSIPHRQIIYWLVLGFRAVPLTKFLDVVGFRLFAGLSPH